jgi:peptidoglycan hydrolase-like protein with peptidoglycan-binding domain
VFAPQHQDSQQANKPAAEAPGEPLASVSGPASQGQGQGQGTTGGTDRSLRPSAQEAAPVLSHWAEDGGGSPPAPPAPEQGQAKTGRPTLQLGAKGEHVVALQLQLNARGAQLSPDGSFGPMTRAAVVSFQQDHGLSPDGVVGPATWGALDGPVKPGPGNHGQTTAPPAGGPGDGPGTGQGTSPAMGQGTGPATPATGTTTGTATGGPGSNPGGADPAQAAAYDAEAQAHLQALQAKGPGGGSGGGHTESRGVASYPPWFTEIQKLLINSRGWGDAEEGAQNFLHRYVDFRQKSSGEPMPVNVAQFLRFIGRSEGNQQAAKKAGKNHTGELTGQQGASNWCQGASTIAMKMAMDEIGVTFNTSYEKWLKKQNKSKSARQVGPPAAHTAQLDPGDIFSLVGPSTPPSGHVATCMEDLGSSILMVSGNAAGESVRIDEAKRGQPPQGYSYWKAVEMGNNKEPVPPSWRPQSGEVWVVTIQKVGSMLDGLDRMRGMDKSSPEFQALLTEYDLVLKAPA